MSPLLTLAGHSLRRRRGFLAAVALLLVLFQFFMTFAARNLELTGRFRQLGLLLPEFVQQWTNLAAASFRGFVLFGYSHPLVQLFLIASAISIGTEPAGEIESKFVDLFMARPVRRMAVIGRTLVVLAGATVGAIGSMLVATWSAVHLLTPPTVRPPATAVVLSLAANLTLLVLAWGGLALMMASWSKRRSTAAAACGLAAFAMFVVDYVGRFWEAVRPLSRISPFHYFNPFAIIGGQPLAMGDVVALVAIFVVSAAIASVAYRWRDL